MNLRTPSPAPEPISIGERGKALVRRVAGSYLQANEPEELDEFDDIFDTTYNFLNRPLEPRRTVTVRFGGQLHATSAVPDASIAAGVIWIAQQLVRAAVTAPAEEGLAQLLAELTPQLAAHTRQTQQVEGVAEELKGVHAELRLLREEISQMRSGSSHPDLQLRIDQETSNSGVKLTYDLYVQNPRLKPGPKPFGAVVLGQSPDAYVAELFRRIESAHHGRTGCEKLAGIGTKLFEDLLPKELQRRLWSVVEKAKEDQDPAVTLQIISDASWIPWQLLKLRDPDAGPGGGAGPFFAEAFNMAVTPPDFDEQRSLPLRKIALVVPGGSNLPRAVEEREEMQKLDAGERRITEVSACFTAVVDALRDGRYDGWHFTGHGLAGTESPDSWSFQLDDAGLEASDLHGAARGLAQTRPLIFLNACHGAAGGFALVGISGLANSFLRVGAGALIGAHWEIGDDLAVNFARAFYRHCFAGASFAESVRRARLAIRDDSGDPSWLAYAAFGHPLAKCPQ